MSKKAKFATKDSLMFEHASLQTITFLDKYMREGFLLSEKSERVSIPLEDFVARLEKEAEITVKAFTRHRDQESQNVILEGYRFDHLVLAVDLVTHFHPKRPDYLVFSMETILAGPKITATFCNLLNEFRFKRPQKKDVYSIHIHEEYIDSVGKPVTVDHGYNTESFGVVYDELYPSVDIQKMVKSFAESDETLLILVGAPGVGKTCLLKKMVYQMAKNEKNGMAAKYVKDPRVLHSAAFWSQMSSKEYDFLLLDDLDRELTPRVDTPQLVSGVAKPTIVNQLLSYSNGLFPVKTKIIITTNLVDESIDPALLRPGRCFDVLDFPHLTYPYARDLWVDFFNLKIEDFDECFPNAGSISQAYFMSQRSRIISSLPKDYLIDRSVSVQDKYLS